jgi:hypothetical protein
MRPSLRTIAGLAVVASIAVPSAQGVRSDAKAMVLQLGDLPAGFGVDRGDYVSNAELATQNLHKNYAKLGRLTGYDVLYTKLGVTGMLGVDSWASIYKTGTGAHDSLMLSMNGAAKEAGPSYRRLAVGTPLGSEARLYLIRATQSGTKVEMYTLAWRDGPVFAEVMAGGIAGTVDPAAVVALAKKQESRIDRFLR